MQVYSCLDERRPSLAFNGLSGSSWFQIYTLLASEEEGNAVLLRACYEGFAVATCLWGVRFGDHMELVLISREDMTKEAVYNPVHHHVTEMTRNASAYAEKLGVVGFTMRSSTRQLDFFAKRFPEWDSAMIDGVVFATLKVN